MQHICVNTISFYGMRCLRLLFIVVKYLIVKFSLLQAFSRSCNSPACVLSVQESDLTALQPSSLHSSRQIRGRAIAHKIGKTLEGRASET